MPPLKHDFDAILKTLPRYLFRIHTSRSQGSLSSLGFRAGREPSRCEESYAESRSLLSAHLLWHKKPSYWISTSSSLLWALVYARWRAREKDKHVSISLIASDRIEKTTIFPSRYLVRYYELEPTGKIWHDKPEGEYLVKWKIPEDAVRGTLMFQDVVSEFDKLMPELAACVDDRPSQLTNELRSICFPRRKNDGGNGGTGRWSKGAWSFTAAEYMSARHIARSFEDEEARGLLILMCLSFRRRKLSSLDSIDAQLKQGNEFIAEIPKTYLFPGRNPVIDDGTPELKEWIRVTEGLRFRWLVKPKL